MATRLSLLLEDGTFAPIRESYLAQIWAARHTPCHVDTTWLRHDGSGYFFATRRGEVLKVFVDHRMAPAASPTEEHLHILLDQSSSMAEIQEAVYAGAVELIEALPEGATARLSTFATTVIVGPRCEKADILERLRTTSRVASGLTSLYDGIVQAVGEEGDAASTQKKTMVIVTDGHDTASRRTRMDAHVALASFRSAAHCRVLFLGSNQDAIESGRILGVPAECALTFGNRAAHALAACRAVSGSLYRSRSERDAAFQTTERSSAAATPPVVVVGTDSGVA